MLEVRRLTKTFGGLPAVADVSFVLGNCESLALIGPNGAGKSTCFNMLGGQYVPSSGSIQFEGRDIAGLPAHEIARSGIGRTFQVAAVFASMTVLETIQTALITRRGGSGSLLGHVGNSHRDEAQAVLDRIGLGEQAGRLCGVLAYGDVKRVEFAIALACRPKLLLMDEPTAGMAVRERFALMDLVSQIVREERLSVLFTEHDMDVVFNYADRVIVLNRGKLVTSGAPADVRADPEVRRIYLGDDFSAVGTPR